MLFTNLKIDLNISKKPVKTVIEISRKYIKTIKKLVKFKNF